jgi:hypothetical protein
MNSRTSRGAAFAWSACALLLTGSPLEGRQQGETIRAPVISERTPSRAYFFDWINSQYEGSTEAHSLTNLEFFRWMHEEYGMELDVYLLDVGNIDDGPYTAGVGRLIPDHYGNLESESFLEQFPRGFGPLRDKAAEFGCRLGIWLGPDGFGDTPLEEQARIDMLVTLCRDFDFLMFKFDAVAGQLRPEKQGAFARAIRACWEQEPELLVLNERVELGEAEPYASTSLWEGIETYIDVFSWNEGTAPHHRSGALARPVTPGLKRLIEDHGVCLSSCLDAWEDDLILQTFNRGSLLAPEIYGSPWFLRDDEFPKLARLCNLYRRYREILIDAIALPEEHYGPHAISRGDGKQRFVTLRNLSWEPRTITVEFDESIGLESAETGGGMVELRHFHPIEQVRGPFPFGTEVEVTIDPFKVCLFAASTIMMEEVGIAGCEYEVARDVRGKPIVIRLLGPPGETRDVLLRADADRVTLDGEELVGYQPGVSFEVEFSGEPLKEPWHRRIGQMTPCAVPGDAEALYEATCFAADNDALEIRSLERSGPSEIPQVSAARAAFLAQPMFINRGIWHRNLLDGDLDTFFRARRKGGALRIDFGEVIALDRLVLRTMDREEHDISPELNRFAEEVTAEYSGDLESWSPLEVPTGKGTIAVIHFPEAAEARYVRIAGAPRRIAEVGARRVREKLDRSAWRASNLFPPFSARKVARAWSWDFTLEEVAPGGYLAIAVEGKHGDEGVTAALRVGDRLVGAPDRAVSFASNTWEYWNVESEKGYTFYFPLTPEMVGEELEAVLLGFEECAEDLRPQLWITAHHAPRVSRELVLHGLR